MILFPAETLDRKQTHVNSFGRKQNHADSLSRKQNYADSLGRKQEIADCLCGSKYAGSENWRTSSYSVNNQITLNAR